MKKEMKFMVLIASVAILMLWSNTPTESTGKNIYSSTINGNKTIDGNFVLNDGLISPGFSPGKITVTGDFTMGGSATYNCELKDMTGAGSGHDQIDITGNVSLASNLDIVLDGYTPNNADQFEIMTFTGTLSGTFTVTWAGTMLADGWQIDYGVLKPNKITIYGPSSPLPVELLNFKVRKQKDILFLSWQTASEQNSDYFSIEHSRNARDFSKLERVQAQGTTYDVHNYIYRHLKPANGINYYRLKQVDFDKKFSYSNIISAAYGSEEFSFYPNPATGLISFNQSVETLTIYDLMGKEILKKKQVESILDISVLEKGIYILEINNGAYQQRLVVSK